MHCVSGTGTFVQIPTKLYSIVRYFNILIQLNLYTSSWYYASYVGIRNGFLPTKPNKVFMCFYFLMWNPELSTL
jgi:hypothetical protein